MSSLFEAAGLDGGPLPPMADRLRPQSLSDVIGQDHLLTGDGPLARMLTSGRLASLVLWGPPGSGKTTIARLLAERVGLHFEQLSAVFSGVADLRKAFDAAATRRRDGLGTLLFIDEIHRFNRAQQDGFLPFVEDGTIVLVGATTENPSFELNAALLSRAQVLVLNRLGDEALELLLQRAETAEELSLPLDVDARAALRSMADGDGRFLLNLAEELLRLPADEVLDTAALTRAVQRRAPVYDKGQDGHYNLISALHKSLRGSDADAGLYWLARMLTAGEDPLYIVRRLVRFAVEDIGLADPDAVQQAMAAKAAYDFLGSPEGELAIAQAVLYLATAPKSNAAYRALSAATRAAKETGSLTPPKHILNAPTRLMKDLGYAEGYEYDHDADSGFSGQDYFPEDMERQRFYRPTERGFEREIAKRLAYWRKLRERKTGPAELVNLLLAIAAGGAVGALGRHFIAAQVMSWTGGGFPWGILFCNVVGSFAMGGLVELMALKWPVGIELRAFMTVGVLGAFTTFSTFSLDTVLLLERGAYLPAALYVTVSVMLSVGGLIAGMALFRQVLV